MKAILSDVVNEYNDRVERLDNTQKELTTIIGQQEERNKKLLLLKNEIINYQTILIKINHEKRF